MSELENELTPCARDALEKTVFPQLVKKYPAFYDKRRLITVFKRARHLFLSCARLIQSTFPFYSLKKHLNIILLYSLSVPSGLFPSGMPNHKPVCNSPLPHTCYMPRASLSSSLYHPNNIW